MFGRPRGFGGFGGLGGRRYNRGLGGNMFGMMLMMQLFNTIAQLPIKPPVTVGLIGAMVALHFLGNGPSRAGQVCISAPYVLGQGRWDRFFQSAFFHADSMHLGYNMLSFLWKGVSLELHYGTAAMAAIISVLLVLGNGFYLVVSQAMSSPACAVGFSGVIFGLKVIETHRAPGHTSIWGMRIPTRYAAWAELILASLISPRASFLGHLCGILAGYVFLFTLEEPVLELTSQIHFGLPPPAHRRHRQRNSRGPFESWEDFIGPEVYSSVFGRGTNRTQAPPSNATARGRFANDAQIAQAMQREEDG